MYIISPGLTTKTNFQRGISDKSIEKIKQNHKDFLGRKGERGKDRQKKWKIAKTRQILIQPYQ